MPSTRKWTAPQPVFPLKTNISHSLALHYDKCSGSSTEIAAKFRYSKSAIETALAVISIKSADCPTTLRYRKAKAKQKAKAEITCRALPFKAHRHRRARAKLKKNVDVAPVPPSLFYSPPMIRKYN